MSGEGGDVVAPPPPSESIMPAKSEDKLEIEKEEKENSLAKSKEKDLDKEEEEEEDEKKDDEKEEEKEEAKPQGGGGGKRKKRNKKKIKTPKVPGFLRSASKERKKDKSEKEEENKAESEGKKDEKEDSDEKKEKEEEKDKESGDSDKSAKDNKDTEDEKKEEKKEDDSGEAEEKKDEEKEDKKDEEKKEPKASSSKIHLPKMPKISKPKFLKKKESSEKEESKEEEKEEKEEKKEEEKGEKEKDDEAKEKEDVETEKKDEDEKDGATASAIDKVPGFFHYVGVPSFLKRKPKTKEEEEEGQELLEKKEEEEEVKGEKEKGEDAKTSSKDEEKIEEEDKEEKKEGESGGGFLSSLRNVANHVPAIFSKKTDKVKDSSDLEAGETKELLEEDAESKKKKTEEKKKSEEEKGDAEVIMKDDQPPKSGEVDPEKGEAEDKKKKGACAVRDFREWERQKRYGLLLLLLLGLLLVVVVIVVCLATSDGGFPSDVRVSKDGKFVTTHIGCGLIEGQVDSPGRFSFLRIPYAAPNLTRFKHSRLPSNRGECHEGTFLAHSHNESLRDSRCLRKYPDDEVFGREDCLTLDVLTGSVVYDDLAPVVVLIGGDDLTAEEEEKIRPTSELAFQHGVVFVDVNYRRGPLGFIASNSLSMSVYPQTSGNYGLGDIITALQWISENIQHFGGHPKRVTLLGRGTGATLVTALTVAPTARGLFQRAWSTDGPGVVEFASLRDANIANQAILRNLQCGNDELGCLMGADAETMVKQTPKDWLRSAPPADLPMKGSGPSSSSQHTWLTADRHLLFESPSADDFPDSTLINDVPVVLGANAHASSSKDLTARVADWSRYDDYAAKVESRIGSFNVSLPSEAISVYNSSANGEGDNKAAFAAMATDIDTICPLQDLAISIANDFTSNVFLYVNVHRNKNNMSAFGDDVNAILDKMDVKEDDQEGKDFRTNMQNMFYTFARTGQLPQRKDMTLGVYWVDDEITTQRELPTCQIWKQAEGIIPNFARKY